MDVSSDRTYPSKRDRWFLAVIWAAVLSGLLGIVVSLTSPGTPLPVQFLFTITMLAGVALVIWIVYSTAYTLTADHLVARSGPFRRRISLAAIQEVRPSRNLMPSLACSLDRLEIRYRWGSLLISPEDKSGFLRDLTSRSAVLAVEGERVVRRVPGSSLE